VHDIGEILARWNGFYVIIGSAAAALTGLTFVVITLATAREAEPSQDGISTFTTPTVVHFSATLLMAALLSAPFRSSLAVAVLLGLVGVGGCIYVVRIARRTRSMESYRPDTEDYIWHVLLPLAAYGALALSALALDAAPARVLFAPAAALLLLIFIGIHNAWDVVVFLAMSKPDVDEPNDP